MPTSKTSKVRKPKPAEQPKRRRLTHEARKSMILQGAIKYFAEVGFSGGTRELALRTGVKQPLLYRFFPSKEDLVKNVYDAVYLSRWRHNWSRLISDRSMPLRERLIEFYDEYAEIMFQREWIRIFLFSGLKGIDINRQYVAFMEENILKRICEEIRHDRGLPSVRDIPITNQELAAFWIFHGGVFYFGVRREVYRIPVHIDAGEFIRLGVDGLLEGYPAVARQILDAELPKSEAILDRLAIKEGKEKTSAGRAAPRKRTPRQRAVI
jgi:AcrR family transcriptional regulator